MFQTTSDRLVVNKSRQTYSDHLFIMTSINPKTPSSSKQVCFLAHQVFKDLNSSINVKDPCWMLPLRFWIQQLHVNHWINFCELYVCNLKKTQLTLKFHWSVTQIFILVLHWIWMEVRTRFPACSWPTHITPDIPIAELELQNDSLKTEMLRIRRWIYSQNFSGFRRSDTGLLIDWDNNPPTTVSDSTANCYTMQLPV